MIRLHLPARPSSHSHSARSLHTTLRAFDTFPSYKHRRRMFCSFALTNIYYIKFRRISSRYLGRGGSSPTFSQLNSCFHYKDSFSDKHAACRPLCTWRDGISQSPTMHWSFFNEITSLFISDLPLYVLMRETIWFAGGFNSEWKKIRARVKARQDMERKTFGLLFLLLIFFASRTRLSITTLWL